MSKTSHHTNKERERESPSSPNSIPPPPPFSPSLISLTVSMHIKHHVYLLIQLSGLGRTADTSVWDSQQSHTPIIAFRHLPPKEGCRKPVLGVWFGVSLDPHRHWPSYILFMYVVLPAAATRWLTEQLHISVVQPARLTTAVASPR